ncbi:hypothetical protein RR11_2735 [Ruegeria sp. R11]|nr:hypothetical protein RR11_2735 [Ruegeria sp. R11]CRL14255.1 hypothetical protein NIT7645_01280 [Phaeobacter italicus]SFG22860.1 hypothetical protein SAMN04488019_101616 [Phaeobacter italicus]
MEIVLGALMDYIHQNMKRRRILKICLLVLIVIVGCGFAYIEWAAR